MKISARELRHYASEPREFRIIERVLLDAAETIDNLENDRNTDGDVTKPITGEKK